MIVSEISSKSTWQDFFDKNGSPSFLQSWEWGELQERLTYGVQRLGLFEDKKLVGIAQVIKINSKRGNFLFIPHGPIIMKHETYNIKHLKNLVAEFRDYLITIAKRDDFSFVRVAPILENSSENQKMFYDLGFKKAPIYMHAERMWVLPLIKSEEKLMSEMRKTTRYSIRKAIRDDVIIEKRTDGKAADDFFTIYEKTAEREDFIPFSKQYVRNEFEAFNKTGNGLFLFGRLKSDSRYLASALILFTKSTAFYHQGASIHTKIPITYLLQWEAIKEAKKRSCRLYNFWGTHLPGRTPKSWPGLSLFKEGFGGYQVDFLTTQDYIVSPKYYFTFLYEKYLAWRRGV